MRPRLAYFHRQGGLRGHAAQCLRVWFLDPATCMTPHLDFAQGAPGKNTGRGIGVIEAGTSRVADVAGLLVGSAAWTSEGRCGVAGVDGEVSGLVAHQQEWPGGSRMKQNHGTLYDVQVMRLAFVLGRPELAKQVAEAAKQKRIAVQIEPDGRQPMELSERKRSTTPAESAGLVDAGHAGGPGGSGLVALPDRGRTRASAGPLDFMLPYA